ncbi:MAG: TatD family hydrolase [Treponema sp.]|jgi:TatD DNase family protein|nr:TatD family hydrolase [Treponema sp.]
MNLVDIGINLTHPSFDKDCKEVMQAAANAGVKILVITGTSVSASQKAHSFIEQNKNSPCKLFFTAGIHPHEASGCDNSAIEALHGMAGQGAIAIGECGLDYCRDYSPRPVQRQCFEKQLELATELKLPLFLHEREAFADFKDMLKNAMQKVPGAVVHCFTGSETELEAYLDMGCHIGITGWICDERRGLHLANLVKKIPSNRLLIETDAPFLAPRDLPGKKIHRNEPKYLPHIAQVIARYVNKDPAVLAEETYANSIRFFGI